MAGLDGIENKIYPGEPMDNDIYDLAPEERAAVPLTPASLEEAIDALEAGHDFLLKGDVFTEDVIEASISYKREKGNRRASAAPASPCVRHVLRHA